jgi:ABC-type phosphate/phosphonate transport system permease subunit
MNASQLTIAEYLRLRRRHFRCWVLFVLIGLAYTGLAAAVDGAEPPDWPKPLLVLIAISLSIACMSMLIAFVLGIWWAFRLHSWRCPNCGARYRPIGAPNFPDSCARCGARVDEMAARAGLHT